MTTENRDEADSKCDHDSLQQRLRESALFRGVDPSEIDQIVAAGHWLNISQGNYIYHQGDNNRHFYIVASGEAELTVNGEDGSRLIVSHIGPGGHFGETSLLTGRQNCLNAQALTDLFLLSFDADTFIGVLLANNLIQRQLSVALADRLRVSFCDHASALTKLKRTPRSRDRNLDHTFFSDPEFSFTRDKASPEANRGDRQFRSTIVLQSRKAAERFSGTLAPVLLTGENGTGRRMVAHEIHRASAHHDGPYTEIDIHNIDFLQLEEELFGHDQASYPFSQMDRRGIFAQYQGGTVVLYNAEEIPSGLQQKLMETLSTNTFTPIGGTSKMALRTRIILITMESSMQQDGQSRLLPALYKLIAGHHFRVAPLREHRRDIPRLVHFYLRRYSLQYGKNIEHVDDQTMGMFMNYDWPGNLAELSSVLQRAVILGKSNEPLNNQILLGVPKAEGKWEFNLLRLRAIRSFLTSPRFPLLPRAIVGIFFVSVLAMLFFGSGIAENNLGLTLSWVVGWPLLIFSFFFLARTWCSICGLSVPGWLAQLVFKPDRPTPQFIRQYSGWLMTLFCILLFWIEITWNAYGSPRLTGWIILTITLCSLLFSVFYKRRVWCRYLCPLGAINALFSMPSILELRSNTHTCTNRCSDHLCYNGDGDAAGCPMFRHPFLVDNNRDCILCGQCVKNCKLGSIHLNLRLAPQELWNLQSPRLEDSVLVVSLAAIFYPFAINQKFPGFVEILVSGLQAMGLPASPPLASSIFFFAWIIFYLSGYALMSQIMARLTGNGWKTVSSMLGYSMIPLVLGAFMAAHLEIFVGGIWQVFANLRDIAGLGGFSTPSRLISPDATFILQFITILGSLIASLYAAHRIVRRFLANRQYSPHMFAPPAFLLCLSAIAYLRLV